VTASDRVPRSLYPLKGHRIDIGGHCYHYLDEGSGDPQLGNVTRAAKLLWFSPQERK
jgi:hypothetical protein